MIDAHADAFALPPEQPLTERAHPALGRYSYDFYKCHHCGRLCTLLQMIKALGPNGSGKCCPCGGLKYSPINLCRSDWKLPRVWLFAIYRLLRLA